MADNRIPVIILTGFLGSGKTTLLNHLLRDPRLTDTAVIVNEFGEIGLDHLLVESAFDEMVLMDNGCLCCSVRGDLVDTLSDLLGRVEAGELPGFGRVMIETTGLADPAPIAQTLATDEATAARFALQGIVTAVDGVNGVETLEAYDEARAQAAMADLMLITKADVPGARVGDVRAAVRALNPGAPAETVSDGAIDPAIILTVQPSDLPAPEAGHHHHHGHGWNIQSASIVIDTPLPWSVLRGWLEWLTALRGPDVLRIKGIVAVEGLPGPVLVHGVQHVFYPARILPDWPDDDHRSRIIVIARDIPEGALRASLDAWRAAA